MQQSNFCRGKLTEEVQSACSADLVPIKQAVLHDLSIELLKIFLSWRSNGYATAIQHLVKLKAKQQWVCPNKNYV